MTLAPERPLRPTAVPFSAADDVRFRHIEGVLDELLPAGGRPVYDSVVIAGGNTSLR